MVHVSHTPLKNTTLAVFFLPEGSRATDLRIPTAKPAKRSPVVASLVCE